MIGGTVGQNISRFSQCAPGAESQAAHLAGAHRMILQLPNGYETLIEEGGRNLSSGQRQRIGLARAMFNFPRLIVLDEPNANLDAEGETQLRRALEVLKYHGSTVVVITHKPALVSNADRLLVMRDGRVSAHGGPAEIMAKLAGNATAPARRPMPANVETLARRTASGKME